MLNFAILLQKVGMCVGGGWKELEELGYIEAIQPNRGRLAATKLANFNICTSIIIIFYISSKIEEK